MNDPDYRLLVSKTSKKVRNCILARSNLDLLIAPFFYIDDVTIVALIYHLGIDLMRSCVYNPYEAASPPNELIRLLVQHAKRKRSCLVFGCDANAHHTQRGSAGINTRGESILNFIIF